MTTQHMDPLIDQIMVANPCSPGDFADLPPLGSLPARAPSPAPSLTRSRRRVASLTAVAALAIGGMTVAALAPSSTPGGDEVLDHAFAQPPGTADILHLARADRPARRRAAHRRGMDARDRRREGRQAPAAAGRRPVHGDGARDRAAGQRGDLDGAVTRDRRTPDAPVRTTQRIGAGEPGLAEVVAATHQAVRGQLDVGDAREVTYEGRDAYEITVREASGTADGAGHRSPADVSITVWIARDTYTPLAIRWGDGADLMMTEHISSFERLPSDTAHDALLAFGGK
jgi:hypothetical protein